MNFDLDTVTEEEIEIIKDSIVEAGGAIDKSTNDFIEGIVPIVKLLALDDKIFDATRPLFEENITKTFNSNEYRNGLRIFIDKNPDFEKDETVQQFTDLLKAIYHSTNETGGSKSKKLFIANVVQAYSDALDSVIRDMDVITVPIELISEDGRMPQFANEGDAGADLYSTVEMDLNPGEQTIIPLGFKVQLPEGYAMLIQPRSGQSAKTKLRICNTPGLIDSGYRGEVGVLVENIDPPIRGIDSHYVESGKLIIDAIDYGTTLHIDKGQRIAQARIVKVPKTTYFETDAVNETLRGEGGFGSSGTM